MVIDEIARDHYDWTWLKNTESGLQAVRADRLVAAKQYCDEALAAANRLAAGDPRRAAGLNNRAVVARSAGNLDGARADYRAASQAWRDARAWIDAMRPTSPAASSVFHMRLESKHGSRLAGPVLAEYHARLAAGSAATLNNRAEWSECDDDHATAHDLYARALKQREAGGEWDDDEPLVALLRSNLDRVATRQERPRGTSDRPRVVWTATASEPFTTIAERELWVVDRPAEFTDEGRLMAALMLVFVIGCDDLATPSVKASERAKPAG